MTGLGWASAYQVVAAIRRRDVSAAEVLEDQLDRIGRHDARLRSVVTLDADGARRRAAEADQALARGQIWGPLHGVGVTVEDVHATAGMRSTFGGYRPFAEHVPAADATVVARLKAAGAIIVGKTNGPCLWGHDSVFPPTRNPWNAGRTAGGSSTGPAVAVAAGLTPFDIGGDTSGSIQCPAAFCGVFGMRPTEHRVPMTGMMFILPVRKHRVLTTAGPIARSVGDLRLALEVISGPDGRDPEVPPVPWRPAGPADLNGLRVAYSPGYPPRRSAPGPTAWSPNWTSWARSSRTGCRIPRRPDPGNSSRTSCPCSTPGRRRNTWPSWTAATGSSPAGTGSSRTMTCS
jgi:amidase